MAHARQYNRFSLAFLSLQQGPSPAACMQQTLKELGVPTVPYQWAGLPFSLQKPQKYLKFKWSRQYPTYTAGELQVEVDALLEGQPSAVISKHLEELLEQLEDDCKQAVPLVLQAKQQAQPTYKLPAIANVSLVLCDDAHIQELNKQYRNKDLPTDVLSFEIPDEAPSVHPLLAELRILLVHGLLHLAGFDHEQGEQQMLDMATQESAVLQQLGWQGTGLITASGASDGSVQANEDVGDSTTNHEAASSNGAESRRRSSSSSFSSQESTSSSSRQGSSTARRKQQPRVPLVALDMDGTLLDSQSKIKAESAEVIRAATAAGVRVLLATGKARPAAIAACRQANLEGDHLLGLAVHGHQGQQLSDAALPPAVVEQAFTWAGEAGISCVAFLGDECATLRLTDQLRELHHRYYEPLADELPNVEALLAGPAVRKLLFMADPEVVESLIKPHWSSNLQQQAAEVVQAVPNMLEVVPQGVNKWAGLQVLLQHLQLPPEQVMAVGDGSNDLEMVSHAGIGVAMGNAVPSVKSAAAFVVSSNDDGGILEAFERFVL
eukprot:gene3247-3523_t